MKKVLLLIFSGEFSLHYYPDSRLEHCSDNFCINFELNDQTFTKRSHLLEFVAFVIYPFDLQGSLK
ncbi:hypothetical protein B6D60_06365 [candidate division KSB1 bacterium 4484_87]|nr:MAG: hypothetical protein B6D60_06365 [candidate division KSB1 bacterium 4484_87]